MDGINRRDALKFASATGIAALTRALTLAAGKEGGDAEKKSKVKVLGLGQAKIACGSTAPGEGWQPYDPDNKGEGKHIGIYIDVDTSEAHFKSVPVYVTSLAANSEHSQWEVVGVTSIYRRLDKDGKGLPLESGFRLYVKSPFAPDQIGVLTIAQKEWYINWIAIGE